MIIGIDPGITGAIAFIESNGVHSVEDLPVMAAGKGFGKVKNQINPGALYGMIPMNSTVYLERISAMPGQGVASMFSMGDTFGCIRAVVATAGARLVIITPQEWKKYYKLGKDKEICRSKAIELFPSAELHRKKDHNRAEALLIANYGMKAGG